MSRPSVLLIEESEQREGSRRARRNLALAVLIALLAWSGAVVRGGFSYDDREAIEDNPVVEGTAPVGEAFRRDYWHHRGDAGHYRPLAALSLRLDRALYGDRAFGFHLTNALLHAAVVLVAGLVLIRLPRGASLLPGLILFAAHPVLADSVAWISGRTSMVSCLGGALALLAVTTMTRATLAGIACGTMLFLGLLGKEDAVVFGLPALLLALRRSRVHAAATVVGSGLALVAALVLRGAALGSYIPEAASPLLAGLPLGERLLFGGRALLEALRVFVWPFDAPPNYRAAAGFIPNDPPTAFAYLGWAPWLILVGLGVARRRSIPFVCAAIAALSLLPVLQLIPAGEIFAPRFLYLPLLLGAAALGPLLSRLSRPALSILVLALLVGAWVRSGVYTDRESYASKTLAHVPHDVGAWNDLGLAREESDDLDGARDAWHQATELSPGYSRAWSNLGRLALIDGNLVEAIATLERAAAASTNNAVARVNLGTAHLRAGNSEAAIRSYEEATILAPGLGAAWRGLGQAYLASNREDAARRALEQALEIAPGDRDTARLLESFR